MRVREAAVDDAGVILGFTSFGPDRDGPDRDGGGRDAGDAGSDGDGELFVLNVHPEAWGRGVGETLLRHACDGLASAGFEEAVLWVVPGNGRARRFYESHGWWCEDETRVLDVSGVDVPEVRYRRRLAG